jgi:hypothetical protein
MPTTFRACLVIAAAAGALLLANTPQAFAQG